MHIDRGRIWEDMPPDACFLHGGDEQGRIRHFGPDFSMVSCSDVTSATSGANDNLFVGQYVASTAITATGTPALTSVNGALALTTGTAANDLYEVIFNGGAGVGSALGEAPFTPVASTVIRCGAEIKINTLASSEVYVGLIVDAAHTEASEAANFIAIRLDAGTASLRRSKDSTAEATAILNPAGSGLVTADTYAEVGFVIRGVTAIEAYFDGQRTEISDVTSLPVVGLYPFVYVETDTTAARTATIRRFTVTQEIV
jgi:hypothetical protein